MTLQNTSSISTSQFSILLVLVLLLLLGEMYLFIYRSLFNDFVNTAHYKALNEGMISNN